MITEQEARESAAKLDAACELYRGMEDYDERLSGTVREIEMQEHRLIQFAKQELSRREAEKAERALPITAEWLRSIGAKKRAINRWRLCDTVNLWLRENLHWVVRIDGFTVIFTTRGQLLDLINALKGGET